MSKYGEALKFLNEMMETKIPLSKEVYSSAICAYSKQGKLAEAEYMFSMMKMAGFQPDVIAYTTMLHAYNVVDNLEKVFAVFKEMESNNVIPDSVACSSLMRAFNKGCQLANVLVVAEFMRERNIPLIDVVFFEMVSACSILRDWKMTTEIISVMEASLPSISVGILNQLLQCIGKSDKIETMIKFYYKIVKSGAEINLTTYSILLKNLLSTGNWRKYVEVMQWMEDGGIQPSKEMYHNILFFAQRSVETEYAAIIKERIETLKSKSGGQTTSLPGSPHSTNALGR